MRQLLVFLIILVVAFFVVGEWRGVYLGLAGQTPMITYKVDHTAEVARTVRNGDHLPLNVSGEVRRGTVRILVLFDRPQSFQTSAAAIPQRVVYDMSYSQGQRIALSEVVVEGTGNYLVRIEFQDATGNFRVRVPPNSSL